MAAELLIENNGTLYLPVVREGVCWDTERSGVPGKLTFTVVKDQPLNFQEGNPVRFMVDGQRIFFGFVFTKKRDKSGAIEVEAYDQMRYLKNKDTIVYEDKTASQVIHMLAADFKLQTGSIEDTGFVIESGTETNQTLFDIIQNALDATLQSTNRLYVLYDDFGKLTLKNVRDMKTDLLICEKTAENFDYSSSIDSGTANVVKLMYQDKTSKQWLPIVRQDLESMKQWGVLQYLEEVRTTAGAPAKAEALLRLYNQKTRTLSIKSALGRADVRAGSRVQVSLNLGDVVLYNFMLVETAKHTFKDNEHLMDLTLIGGEFIA